MFGSTNKLSKLIEETINKLTQTSSLQPNTPENAIAMYISAKGAINDLLILPDSLNPQDKIQFFMQIDSQISPQGMGMNNRTGMGNQGMMNQGMMNQGMMNPGMGNQGMMNPGMMNPGMMNPGMGNQGMMNQGMMNQGMMNQSSEVFGSMFGSTQPQNQGMFGSSGSGMFGSSGSGMFGSSGSGMFTNVIQQLNQLKQQFDNIQGMGGPENDMTDSMKVQSVQPILIPILISLNALAMQLYPMAHPNKPIENILKDKCDSVLDSVQGSQFRQPGMQQSFRQPGMQQSFRQRNPMDQRRQLYNEIGGRRRTRRRKQSGGYYPSMSNYGKHAASFGGRRKRRKSYKKQKRSRRR